MENENKTDHDFKVVDFSEYEKLPGVRSSQLKEGLTSMLHYKHRCDNAKDETDAMRIGRASHLKILEPSKFAKETVEWKGGNRAGKIWQAFKEENKSKIILKSEELKHMEAIDTAVKGNPLAMEYLIHGEAEVSLTWPDSDTGLICKARYDWVFPGGFLDVKSTQSTDYHSFERLCYQLGYHVQLALYFDGYTFAKGKEPNVKVITVEQKPPHDVVVYNVTETMIEQGRKEYRETLRKVAKANETGKWPGRETTEQDLYIPIWATQDNEPFSLSSGGEEMPV